MTSTIQRGINRVAGRPRRVVIAVGAAGILLGLSVVVWAWSGSAVSRKMVFSGTLRGTSGVPALTFTFRRKTTSGAVSCVVTTAPTVDPVTSAFTASFDVPNCADEHGTSAGRLTFEGDDITYDVDLKDSVAGSITGLVKDQLVTAAPYAHFAERAEQAATAGKASTAEKAVRADTAGTATVAQSVIPAKDGWVQLGADRHLFTRFWNKTGIPRCVGGETVVDIESPRGTTRDHLWTGTISVFAREGGAPWDVQTFRHNHIWGYTVYGNGWGTADISGGGKLTVDRTDDWANAMKVHVPCQAEIQQLYIQVDVLSRFVLGG